MYETALYRHALHYTALHCTALHCNVEPCTALHCTALHCTAQHFTVLSYSTLFSWSVQHSSVGCNYIDRAQPSDPCILNIEPSWLVGAVSQTWIGSERQIEWVSEPGSLPLPQAAPVAQHMPLHLLQSLTSGSCSCHQSLGLPRLMVRYSWWRQSLGVIFTAPNSPHSIFDPLSCPGTQCIRDKVMVN